MDAPGGKGGRRIGRAGVSSEHTEDRPRWDWMRSGRPGLGRCCAAAGKCETSVANTEPHVDSPLLRLLLKEKVKTRKNATVPSWVRCGAFEMATNLVLGPPPPGPLPCCRGGAKCELGREACVRRWAARSTRRPPSELHTASSTRHVRAKVRENVTTRTSPAILDNPTDRTKDMMAVCAVPRQVS